MKKFLIRSLTSAFIGVTMFQVSSSAATIDANDKFLVNNEVKAIEFSLEELNQNSVVKSVDGKLVDREANIECNGTTTVLGQTVKFKMELEIPYTTYEDSTGKFIYSVDDDNIVSYLKSNNSLIGYKQGYAYSKISKDKKSAKILGYGTATASLGPANTSVNLDISTNIYPTSGK